MKQLVIIYTLMFLLFGCKKSNLKSLNNSENSENVRDLLSETFSYNNNVFSKNNINIDVLNDNFKYSVILTIDNEKQIIDLDKKGIPTKTPVEIIWYNNEYACMLIWWSQAISRHIFLPMKKENSFIYLDKNITKMDSINNTIVYVDTVLTDNKVIFAVENLLTRKTKRTTAIINKDNGIYPYYDSIQMRRNKIIIHTPIEKLILHIQDINK